MRHLFGLSLLVCLLAAGLSAQSNKATNNNSGVTAANVGDADSFGRAVIYLGVAQSGIVYLTTDCTQIGPIGPNDQCVTVNAAPAPTVWDFEDLGTFIQVPAKSTHSLFCFALTPLANRDFNNTTGASQVALFRGQAVIRIENAVLNDPSLIDPTTGLPFGGSFTAVLGTHSERRTLAANDSDFQNRTLSRDCVGGLVSRNSLIQGYGLSAAQADAFFKNQTTFHFGSKGAARMVDDAQYFYGIRIYGD